MNLQELLDDCHETKCLSAYHVDLIERNLRIKTALENYQRAVTEPPLTKREWCAGMALQGMIANGERWDGQGEAEKYAKFAVAQADALIVELSKPPTP